MTLPIPERFHLETLDALCREARRLGLALPVADPAAVLAEPVMVGGRRIPNRFCVQPMEGGDAGTGGVPGELTLRRYRRYAEGGFGLIWMEATAVDGQCRSNPRQLWMNRRNVNAFAELVRDIKQAGRHRWGHEVIVLLQLSHAGRYSNPEGVADPLIAHHEPGADRRQGIPVDYPVVSDETLDRLQEAFVVAGSLAMEAGFDGVDVKACHGDLPAELLTAFTRPGRYGGSLENRSRFLRETTARLRTALPGTLLASRIDVRCDVGNSAETVALAGALRDAGLQLLNVADATERVPPLMSALLDPLEGPAPSGPAASTRRLETPSESEGMEHPLVRFARLAAATRILQQAVPDIPVVAGGLSWFRHFLPQVAAGVVREGGAALIGVGRAALAYPSLAGDLIRTGRLDPDKCCITCSACIQLIKDGGTAGCAIMDSDIYGAEYRHRRHFALDHLREEARRCLGCEPAPCRAACPTRIDVPAFIKAFADDDIALAYAIIRKTNVLPGMCALLCPVGSMCEGRCVTNTLEGNPIPIHDIQHAVAWSARQSGLTGVRVPEADSGKRIAVVGGGPAGVACAVTLLERGHHVVLFERASRLGGTPELAIRSSRFTGAHDEVESLLQPALYEARLTLKFGCELGRDISLEDLRRDHDAVFLAAGVWGEQSLGHPEGVLDGVTFLRKARSREIRSVPPRVILLAGGDSAMDSARVACELGARELTIVYAGALSEMHWHMPDGWFRTEGVHFMTLTRPLGYRVEAGGKVSGLRIQLNAGGTPGPEQLLEAGLIIQAMGLGIEESLAVALQPCRFSEAGLVQTLDGASLSCGLPGVYAGGGLINGGAAVVQCVEEGMRAGREIDGYLLQWQRSSHPEGVDNDTRKGILIIHDGI